MQCPACQHTNPEQARFCNGCGTALAPTCGSCGQENPAGSRFCNACGAPLGATPAAAPQPATEAAERLSADSDPRSYTPRHLADRILNQKSVLEGERKHVTVLFADLHDSVGLAQRIGDPEATHALLDRAFQQILAQVHGFEGTINQFTGDGVMALFGAPIALEDAPQRAALAALGIQRALAALDREAESRWGHRFQMRIGIHCGPVVVGAIGDDLRMDYTAIGDTTNLASRLQALAPPGGIVVSEAMHRLVDGFFEATPLDDAEIKGIAQPVRAYELLRARAGTHRIEARSHSDEGLTTYVGRERELDALLDAFDQASSGRGLAAFVVGEAGLGKSRLLHEFRRRLEGREHAWIEGRCASYAQSTPFHAVADAIRRLHGIDDRDDEAAALAKLEARESELGENLQWTLPYLRVLLSLPSGDEAVDALDPLRRRAELCRALHARIFRVAHRTPMVLVVEDMHWVDTATDEFLTYVAESIPASRVLLILTHRPGYQHNLGDRSYHVRIPLSPLSSEAMSRMVDSVLDVEDLPAPVRDLIAAKAEGNPLFVEEVTASLLEEGVLALSQGRAVLTRDLADVAIPDRIQDVLMARLDRLPEEPKRAIQIASVIGREFALRLLSRIHEAAHGLDEIVGELRALELIYEKASHPELAYMFKHALTHEVAYDSLLRGRRRTLHRVVGAAIEELYPDRIAEHYEALAHHFAESEDHERALHYHERASEKSAATYANHAAIDHCRKALAEAEHLGDVERDRLFALHARVGVCSWLVSDFGPSARGFRAASEFASNPGEASLMMARAAFSHLWDHDYPPARDCVAAAVELANQAGGAAAAGHAFAIITSDQLDLIHGEGIEDDREAERAVALAERSSNRSVLVATLGQLAQRYEWRGEFRRAAAIGDRAMKLADVDGNPGDAMFAAWFAGIAAVCLGDYTRGLEVLGAGLEVSDRVGDRAIAARLLNTLGWAHAEFGDHERAVELNRAGTRIAREAIELGLIAGAPELYANSAINLAGNYIALDRLDEAEAQLQPIHAQYRDDPDPWMRWRWSVHLLHAQARLELARGEPEAALVWSSRELAAVESTGARKLACLGHELSARIRLAMDARDEARAHASQAAEIAESLEHPAVVWRARGVLSEIARRAGAREDHQRERAAAARVIEHLAPGVPDRAARIRFLALTERPEDGVIGGH